MTGRALFSCLPLMLLPSACDGRAGGGGTMALATLRGAVGPAAAPVPREMRAALLWEKSPRADGTPHIGAPSVAHELDLRWHSRTRFELDVVERPPDEALGPLYDR